MARSPFTWCAVIAAALAAGAALAETPVLSEFRAEYKVGSNTIDAGMVINRLQQEGDRWRYESNTDPSGLVSLFATANATATSILELHGGKLRQLQYTYRDKDKKKKAHTDADFDWANNKVALRYGDSESTLDLTADTFDATSIVLALSLALERGFEEITLHYLRKNGIRKMTYRNEGEESVSVPFGDFTAVKVRQIRKPGKRYITGWYVPELGYLPVRLEQYKKDKLVVRTDLIKLERE